MDGAAPAAPSQRRCISITVCSQRAPTAAQTGHNEPCAMTAPDYSPLDDALDQLDSAGPELRNGNSNHAPMAIEALCALGRPQAVQPWLDRYRDQLMPRPAQVAPIAAGAWASALGDARRVGDWFEHFHAELDQRPWAAVLDEWVARLAPGIVAAAMHGVIRTGHAVRALALEDTPLRRRELADGLAYWAAEYLALPAGARAAHPGLPSQAIGSIAMIPPAQRVNFGSLSGALGQLDTFEPFRAALGAVATGGDPHAFLADLTATFARVYLGNANDFLTTIAFVHTVTGPAALRPMLPYLPADTARAALAYAWQASAALLATFGSRTALPQVGERTPDPDALVARAIASGDEHAIKFTATCLGEHAISREPAFLQAADHAIVALAQAP
jgi:hypothetical protein